MKAFVFAFGILITSSLFASNPHHRLHIALEEEVRKVEIGQTLLKRTEGLRYNQSVVFYCMDLSCQEEFIYGEFDNLLSANGQFYSAPHPYLGWIVFELLYRSWLDNEMHNLFNIDTPRVKERELLVAYKSATYLNQREAVLGQFSRSDDYYYSDRYDYALNRGYGLLHLLRAHQDGLAAFKYIVEEREQATGQSYLSVEEYINSGVSEVQKNAALKVLELYEQHFN